MRRVEIEKWMAAIPQVFRRNTGLRLLALALAIGLWAFVNAARHEAETGVKVPISYVGLPRGLEIVGNHPNFVSLEVTGPSTLLSLLEPEGLALRLDLSRVAPGQASFRIDPAMFNVPRGTTVTRVSPSEIVLEIDRLVTRELSVRVPLTGSVPRGYKIASVEAKPPTIAVTGLSRYVLPLTQIDSEPVEVGTATGDIDRFVGLIDPNPQLKLSASLAEARVTVVEVVGSREFHDLKIQVHHADTNIKLDRHHADVTVGGPIVKLASLDLSSSVYVDADGLHPGSHDVPVQVSLPEGLRVLRQVPAKVRLRVYRAKRESNG